MQSIDRGVKRLRGGDRTDRHHADIGAGADAGHAVAVITGDHFAQHGGAVITPVEIVDHRTADQTAERLIQVFMSFVPGAFNIDDLYTGAVTAGKRIGVVGIDSGRRRLTVILVRLKVRGRRVDVTGRRGSGLNIGDLNFVQRVQPIDQRRRLRRTGHVNFVIAVQIGQGLARPRLKRRPFPVELLRLEICEQTIHPPGIEIRLQCRFGRADRHARLRHETIAALADGQVILELDHHAGDRRIGGDGRVEGLLNLRAGFQSDRRIGCRAFGLKGVAGGKKRRRGHQYEKARDAVSERSTHIDSCQQDGI